MFRNLQILIFIFVIGGCAKPIAPSPIIQTKVLLCPGEAPPECEKWIMKKKEDFVFNTELEVDWLKGQELYTICNIFWNTYSKAWNNCKESM